MATLYSGKDKHATHSWSGLVTAPGDLLYFTVICSVLSHTHPHLRRHRPIPRCHWESLSEGCLGYRDNAGFDSGDSGLLFTYKMRKPCVHEVTELPWNIQSERSGSKQNKLPIQEYCVHISRSRFGLLDLGLQIFRRGGGCLELLIETAFHQDAGTDR